MKRQVSIGGLSLLLILLFIGAAMVSATQTTTKENTSIVTSRILYVGGDGPGNYTQIQDAIDDANDNDTVFVYDDSSPYYEHIVVEKSIYLIGENKETTVINGENSLTVLTIKADRVTLSSFTIQKSGVLWVNSGIEIRSSHNTISGNIVSQNYNGISLFSSSNYNNITGNTIMSNEGDGIYLYNSYYNLLSENIISDNYGGIVLVQSDYNTVSDNVFHNDGIVILGFYQNTVTNNLVNGKPLVFLNGKSDTVVNEAGQVVLVNCHNITIQNCELFHTSIGIYLGYSNSCRISRNNISSCPYGIILVQSDSNNISMNSIVKNTYGISFNTCNRNNIMWNTISFNKYIGIALDSAHNNTISTNNIKFNGGLRNIQNGFGLRLSNSSYTRVAHNNFVLNAFNVYPVFSPFCSYNKNYWNRPRFLPVLILGVKPFIQFDWCPAQEPYDIEV
jgi:parallel beta-helix repeat protein